MEGRGSPSPLPRLDAASPPTPKFRRVAGLAWRCALESWAVSRARPEKRKAATTAGTAVSASAAAASGSFSSSSLGPSPSCGLFHLPFASPTHMASFTPHPPPPPHNPRLAGSSFRRRCKPSTLKGPGAQQPATPAVSAFAFAFSSLLGWKEARLSISDAGAELRAFFFFQTRPRMEKFLQTSHRSPSFSCLPGGGRGISSFVQPVLRPHSRLPTHHGQFALGQLAMGDSAAGPFATEPKLH